MSNQESKTSAPPPASPKAAASAPEPAKAAAIPTPAAEAQPSLRAEPQSITFTDADRNVVIPTQPSKAAKE